MSARRRSGNVAVDIGAVLAAVTQLDGQLPMREAFVESLCDERHKNKIVEVLKTEFAALQDVEIAREDGLRLTLVFPE